MPRQRPDEVALDFVLRRREGLALDLALWTRARPAFPIARTEEPMATAADIMTPDVATLDPQMSLRDALDVLRGEEVTGAPVLQGDAVVGVVSATDILEFQATEPGVPTARPDTEWVEFDAPEEWRQAEEENPPAYFIDFWANAGADATARFGDPDAPEWDRLEDHVVAEVMTRRVLSVTPRDPVRDVAHTMKTMGVHRVLVMEDGVLRGIVTSTDIVTAVADGRI